MSHVTFYGNGEGVWVRRDWAEQCDQEVFMAGECQGVKGHKGLHWCYQPDGSYAWDDNEDDPQEDGCSGTTPPGHKSYVHPADKAEDHYRSHYVDSEVTDPAEIERLNQGEIEDGESLNQPITDPVEIERLQALRDEPVPDKWRKKDETS